MTVCITAFLYGFIEHGGHSGVTYTFPILIMEYNIQSFGGPYMFSALFLLNAYLGFLFVLFLHICILQYY